MRQRPFLIGVAGGSGSGKTYFSNALQARLGPDLCEIIFQDNFYIDQSNRFDFDGGSVNFDHPDSIDFKRLRECLCQLKNGEPAQIPIYDFSTHTRSLKTLEISPKPIIIVDGILIFHSLELSELFDRRIFFDTPESLRFQRRLERDVKDRGRTPEGVRLQFLKQVKPMHDLFVEPSKGFAHTVVQDPSDFQNLLNEELSRLALFAAADK